MWSEEYADINHIPVQYDMVDDVYGKVYAVYIIMCLWGGMLVCICTCAYM